MAYAGLATRGYSEASHLDGSVALVVFAGMASTVAPNAALATGAYGIGTDIGWVVRRGYCAYPGLVEPIPANKQYKDVGGLPWVPPALSILQGASPPAVNGDVMVVDTFSSPGNYPITLDQDGTFIVAVNFDTARQSFVANRIIAATGVFDGEYTNWINNVPPSQPGLSNDIDVTIGTNFGPIDLNNLIRDIEGDPISYSVDSNAMPPGIQLSGSLVSGIPTAIGGFTPVFTATDITGDSSLLTPLFISVLGTGSGINDWNPVDDSDISGWGNLPAGFVGGFQVLAFQINYQQGAVVGNWVPVNDAQMPSWNFV